MKLKFTNPILPIVEIRITDEFSRSMPRLEKLKKCMDFYRANGYFDRQIIVDSDKTLHDGYCAYLTAYLLDVEKVGVMVGEKAEPIKAAAPATPEPAKLYCIKSYKPVDWLTKGNVYTCEAGRKHLIRYDGCEVLWGEWFTRNIDGHKLTDHLVPLVSRPAKVGEWVYILCTAYGDADLFPGDIAPVISALVNGGINATKDPDRFPEGLCYWQSEYLVLDGYTGDAE